MSTPGHGFGLQLAITAPSWASIGDRETGRTPASTKQGECHGQEKNITRTEVARTGRSLQTRGREAALRQRARRAIARGEPAGDRIPYQRMGIVAWAVVTDVEASLQERLLGSR